ncbi:MAG TPA: D-alanyl-D-alanine carboxypeptidase [Caulobacteraceae bacterium]|nr:D-alanyl-D-alanine carboxypeptidase [Caulobacteraceae bacterium]
MSQTASRKSRLAAIAVLAASLGCLPSLASAQLPYLQVSRYEPKNTAIVMDARTGEILYSERADSPRYPASVTKVMTFYLAFEALAAGRLHLNDMLTVSPLAAAQPATKLGLRAGEKISLENALDGMAVHSANDMAVAVAERIGGTESRFAAMMTQKAQQLGMTNTRYVNANGLPDSRQVTTAHDIAILTRALLRDFPQYYHFFGQQAFTYRGRTMVNTNHLLGKMPGVDGLKTGFTNAAGFNLDASAVRNGHRLIAVVMGSSSSAVRNADVEGLLLTGFDIMDRRDRGERLTMTQNMFGAPREAGRSVVRPPVWQGEGDADPIGVVLTRTTASAAPLALSQSMTAPHQARSQPAARKWWVQLGQFRSERQARSEVARIAHRYARVFDDAEGSVDGRGHAYRARFSGFTEASAREACSRVRAHGQVCAVGGPA